MDPVREAIEKYPVIARCDDGEIRLSPHGYLYMSWWDEQRAILTRQDAWVLIQLLQDGLKEAEERERLV